MAGEDAFRPLGALLGEESPHAARPGAWIADRELLTHRKWSPATMAALHTARQAVARAGWGAAELRDAALVVGTSRGNAAGWLGPWPGRRPFKLMAASNTIHSEPATAISIEFGITGPNQVIASGCAAGLDAIGTAMMMVGCGMATRALAVAVDLPLVPLLLDNYAASGLLSSSFSPDPYSPAADGFIPAEGAAAIAFGTDGEGALGRLLYYSCNSDACDPVGIPADGGMTPALVERALGSAGPCGAICPHGTGTQVQARADASIFSRCFPPGAVTLHPLKPFTGHTIGASGLLETVILADFLSRGMLPPNKPGLHAMPGFDMPSTPAEAAGPVLKLSHGMGGHNSALILSPP